MQNPEDISDPTTALDMALELMSKAFQLNNTTTTNNNQRSSANPYYSQIAQLGMYIDQDRQMLMVDDNVGNQFRENAVQNVGHLVGQNAVQNQGTQNVGNQNGLGVVLGIANQHRNGNVVTAWAEGNSNEINGKQIRLLKSKKQGSKALKRNQASTSGTQSDNAPVYDLDGSTEVPKDENCYDHDIFNMLTHKVQYNDLQIELDHTKEKVENYFIKKEKEYAVLWNNVNNTTMTRRPHPRGNSNNDRVPSKSKSSCLSNNVEKIEENHRNSQIPKNQKHMSSECNNITLAIQNAKSEIVCVMCKQCLVTANHDVCMLNYVNNMNSRADNRSANVSIRENQKKHKANAKKLKELGSTVSLASSRPSKPRTCLSTSNPSKPSSKGFSNSASFLGSRYDSHDVNDRVGKSIRSFVRRIIQIEKIKLFPSLSLLLLLMHPINVNNNKIQLHLLQL
ncbi:hypothetical protein Tco_1039667 [Tanacetum coccineum]